MNLNEIVERMETLIPETFAELTKEVEENQLNISDEHKVELFECLGALCTDFYNLSRILTDIVKEIHDDTER
jgi:hypothetical protein